MIGITQHQQNFVISIMQMPFQQDDEFKLH